MKINKKYTIIGMIVALVLIVVISAVSLFHGKNKNEKKDKSPKRISTHTASQVDGKASARTKEWFDGKVSGYIEKNMAKEFKLYTDVYGVKTGINQDNVLLYASANVSVYFDENQKDVAVSEFSDNFARELAKQGASGNIKLSAYIVPSSVYKQIEESNYRSVEDKASGMEGYHKYSFNYTGAGDAAVQIQKPAGTAQPKNDLPEKEQQH